MPLVIISEPQRQLELRRAEANAEWERRLRRRKLVVLAIIGFWNLVGLGLMGMAMATTNVPRGEALLAAGFSLGYGGMTLTLMLYLVRLAEQGGA